MSCGGGGGGSSSSATPTTTTTPPTTIAPTTPEVFASQVTISSDIAKNRYPTSYIASALTPVIDDTCLITASSINYPTSYQGVFSLPQVVGNFASTNIGLGVGIKDN